MKDELTDEAIRADFCLEILYKKESENPSRVFHCMSELIDTLQEIDKHLVKSIDVRIEPILLLEDIEAGSIKAWLSSTLKAIPDESLFHLDWKPMVGQYLVKAKYIIINFLEGKTTITDAKELKPLEDEIYKLAEQTQVRHLPAYIPPRGHDLLEGFKNISASLSYLGKEDSVSYITRKEQTKFNMEFKLVPESIESLLAKETLTAENELILKVKKPDYLGESMWDLRHGTGVIQVTISDTEWLNEFQDRKIGVRPGDSIRAIVKISHKYDFDGELISTHYDATKILEVIQMPNREQLELPNKQEGQDNG